MEIVRETWLVSVCDSRFLHSGDNEEKRRKTKNDEDDVPKIGDGNVSWIVSSSSSLLDVRKSEVGGQLMETGKLDQR